MENHMLHKTAYVLCVRRKGIYAKVTPASFPGYLDWEIEKAYVPMQNIQYALHPTDF